MGQDKGVVEVVSEAFFSKVLTARLQTCLLHQ